MPQRKKRTTRATRRKRFTFVLYGLIALVGIGLLVGFWFAVRFEEVTITDVFVTGTHFTDAAQVEVVGQGQLSGLYAWLVPRKNALVYPRHSIEEEVKKVFVSVKEASVHRNDFTAITISITEHEPVGIWCEGGASFSPCYFLSESGLLFAEASPVPDEEMIQLYKSAALGLGDVFLEGRFTTLHELLPYIVESTERTISEVIVDEHDDVTARFAEGGELWFTHPYEPRALLENISSTFSSNRFDTEERLEYADFRFGNKVYVKFFGE